MDDTIQKDEVTHFCGFDPTSISHAQTYTNTFKTLLTSIPQPLTKSPNPAIQYLGLDPQIKFRCLKCQITNFQTLTSLNTHLTSCKSNFETTITPITTKTQTNYKITRRVYLCSACGVYFEIWKLFLHMRTAHKRYICLICLGLFSIAERLSNHLSVKHQICGKSYGDKYEFLEEYENSGNVGAGGFYVMCCHCEQMFTEKDDFDCHDCGITNGEAHLDEIKDGGHEELNGNLEEEKPEEEDVVDGVNEDEVKNVDEVMDVEEAPVNDEIKVEKLPSPPTPQPPKPQTPPLLSPPPQLSPPTPSSPPHTLLPPPPEIRKVPKVTLRLPIAITPQSTSDSDSSSSDSQKLTVDTNVIADPTIPIIDLGLHPPLQETPIQTLLKTIIRATHPSCIYCNHARKIAVNGKQLALHIISEHRFSATIDSITEEELLPENFVRHINQHLEELSGMYFNLESYDSNDPEMMVVYDRTYECFQCRFVTTIHKELYLHNRKMHQKTLLLCVMCKSTFYSTSELQCHLCPGNYLSTKIEFRCCLCPVKPLPSAFRLMVHLRKRHHACDVCLETCSSQSKLSNHVWKHKLHHLCYKCGIAYRNKPDITKHLFWKHGTESVLCKKCLQKKWKHVYHFCIPPIEFMCDECGMGFKRAVALKVHKRVHSGEAPYGCEECESKFISRKLVDKHVAQVHRGMILVEDDNVVENGNGVEDVMVDEQKVEENLVQEDIVVESKPKPIVDVYDLPALNLSESDSDDETEPPPPQPSKPTDETLNEPPQEVLQETLPEPQPQETIEEPPPTIEPLPEPPIVDGIWDNFQNYQASQNPEDPIKALLKIIEYDHDYCLKEETVEAPLVEPLVAPPIEDSSSESDSSSCSCGSNCSCSTSSDSSSSSSDSEETKETKVVPPVPPKPIPELTINESDLDTNESETDEEFYDKSPQVVEETTVVQQQQHHQQQQIEPPKRKSKKRKKLKNKLQSSESESDLLRLSKRRRVPNKFYGYSSDDNETPQQQPPIIIKPPEPPQLEWNIEDLPVKPVVLPPPPPPPVVEVVPPVKVVQSVYHHSAHHPPPRTNLYCYCQCPYDEVSEMIACDGKKCAIEWFHFECVGIMVPPKGKWFCPDCRKQTTLMGMTQRPEYFMSN